MRQYKKMTALFLAFTMPAGLCACSKSAETPEETSQVADAEQKAYIGETRSLANNEEQECIWHRYGRRRNRGCDSRYV